MKFFLTLLPLWILPMVSSANPWNDLEPGTVVRIKEDLQALPSLVLPKGSRFAVQSINFFGPPYLAEFSLRLFPCPETLSVRKTELLILDDKYGFELDWNCKISMFLEVKDFYQESYFENVE